MESTLTPLPGCPKDGVHLFDRYNSWDISAYEMGLISLILLPFMIYKGSLFRYPGSGDLVLLVVLGVIFTGFARILFVKSQRYLSGKIVGLTLVLEVIYGVIFALILLSAVPTQRELVGGVIVVLAVLFETLRVERKGRIESSANA